MLSRMVCTESLTSAIATLALDCTLSFNRSRGSERVIFLKLRLPQISCCSMLISEKPFPRNPLLILQAQVFFLGCVTRPLRQEATLADLCTYLDRGEQEQWE